MEAMVHHVDVLVHVPIPATGNLVAGVVASAHVTVRGTR